MTPVQSLIKRFRFLLFRFAITSAAFAALVMVEAAGFLVAQALSNTIQVMVKANKTLVFIISSFYASQERMVYVFYFCCEYSYFLLNIRIEVFTSHFFCDYRKIK
ncbi:hypothetical protein D9M68_698450 [compost metagenome]